MRKPPVMLRMHFQYVANVLRSERPTRDSTLWSDGACDEWSTIVLSMARAFQGTNPRFDRAKFLDACGMED